MEFFKTLFSDYANWGIEHYGAVATIVGLLIVVLGMTLNFFSGLWRRVFPKKETPKPFYQVSNPDQPLPKTSELPLIHHSIPHLERRVQGREEELKDLRAGLLAKGEAAIVNSGAVLQGHGGIGKTMLARYYVEEFGAQYGGIFWAVAENEGQLAEALIGLAPQLGVNLDNLPPKQGAQAVLTAMAQDGRDWLCVYDNVTEFADIRNLIPKAHLIVTTRAAAGWDGIATLVTDILGFDTQDSPAVQVLMEAAGREDDAKGARDLAEALGGLPLALVMAGVLIRTEGYGFADYQERIADVIAQVPKNAAYPDSVIGAVWLSYERLPEDAQAVADILAWWAAERLTPDLLSGAPAGEFWDRDKADLSDEMIALVSDPGRVRQGFHALVDASLLTRENTADGPHGMHRMTSVALRALQVGDGAATAVIALLAAVYPYDIGNSDTWTACRRLTPHVRALWESGRAPRSMEMGYLLNQASVFLLAIADFDGGLALAEASFAITAGRLPKADRNYAAGLLTLAVARMQGGDLAGAERDMARAVRLREEHHPESEDLAVSYNNMGGILCKLARVGQGAGLPEAIRYHQRALALRRCLHGRRSEPVAQSLHNLAEARGQQGRGAAALRLHAASRGINPKVLRADDARLAYGAMDTGAAWLKAGRADQAEPLFHEALDIWRAVYVDEPQHPQLRDAAEWLICCLLVRAAAGENKGKREMQARQLAGEFGLDWDERVATAAQYPYAPDSGGTGTA